MSDDEEKPTKVDKEAEKVEQVEQVDELLEKKVDDSQEITQESAKKEEDSVKKEVDSVIKEEDSVKKEEDSVKKEEDSVKKEEEPIKNVEEEPIKKEEEESSKKEEEPIKNVEEEPIKKEESLKKEEESKKSTEIETQTETQTEISDNDEIKIPLEKLQLESIHHDDDDDDDEKGLLGGGPSDYSDEESDENDEGEDEDEDGEVSHTFKKSKSLTERTKRKREITSACSRASDAAANKKKIAEEEKKLFEKRASRPHDPQNPSWLKTYEKHRERVSTAESKLDTKSPCVNKHKYTSPTTFNNSLREFTRIEKENAVLLHRIANIFQGNGKVDCHLEDKKRYMNNEVAVRRHRLLNITFENLALVKKIRDVRSSYVREEQLKEFEKHEEVMQKNSYFPLFWKVKKPYVWDDLEERVLSNACLNPRPRVFMDIRIGKIGDYLGRIVMELRADIVPYTAENFRTLCTSSKFGYDCCTFYRIYPGLFWQGGERIVDRDTHKERKSLYGDFFPDENFKLKHDRPGTLSMANEGKENSNGSHFIITACALPPLNNKNVVFGNVIAGMGVLKEMNKFSGMCINSGEPNRRIWVSATGEMFPGADISEFQDSEDDILEDSDEDDDTPRKSSGRGGSKNTPRPKPKMKVVKKPEMKSETETDSSEDSEQTDMKEEILDPDTSIMIFPNSEKSIVKEQKGALRSRPRPSPSTTKKTKK